MTAQVQIDRADGLSSSTAVKGPCRVATTGDISLEGEQTIDGVAVVEDDRVLVKDQSDGSENGIYVVSTGDWRRAADFSRNDDVRSGTMIRVVSGTGAAAYVLTTSDPIELGVTSLAFAIDTTLGYAPLASPAFTGNPTAPTQSAGNNSTRLATTAFVTAAIAAVLNGVSAAFDTLAEIATAITTLQDDASAAEIWAGTSTKYINPAGMQAALAEVTLTDGATVTVDFTAGINFKLSTIGGNRTLAATVSSAVVGRSGYIRIVQDGTGSRTLDTSASPWKNVNSQDIVLSTAASAEDVIYYQIISTTKILLSMARAIG